MAGTSLVSPRRPLKKTTGHTRTGGVSLELKSEMKAPGEGMAVEVAVGKDALVSDRSDHFELFFQSVQSSLE